MSIVDGHPHTHTHADTHIHTHRLFYYFPPRVIMDIGVDYGDGGVVISGRFPLPRPLFLPNTHVVESKPFFHYQAFGVLMLSVEALPTHAPPSIISVHTLTSTCACFLLWPNTEWSWPYHTLIHTDKHEGARTHTHTHADARTQTQPHTCMHAHTHACIHAGTHTLMHAHAHTHSHTHV